MRDGACESRPRARRRWWRAWFLALPWPLLLAAPSCTDAGDTADAGTSSSSTGSGGHTSVSKPSQCNGHAELCSRRYDQVTYPGTHGSYSNIDDGFMAPDQTHTVARQLSDGVRVLHFEVHVDDGQTVLCHSICAIGKKPLVHDLAAVKSFLEQHPDNVVTLLLERSDPVITADGIGDAFDTTGLSAATHVQKLGDPWPTLSKLIEDGQQVIALLDDTSGSHHDFLLPRWSFTWETPWDNETAQDFGRCNADRGTQGNPIYVVDTYLENQLIPSANQAAVVNYDPFLIDRLLFCKKDSGTRPNFAMVNFYEASDLFHVVDVLNGFLPTPHPDLADFPPSSFGDAGVDGDAGDDAGDAGDGG